MPSFQGRKPALQYPGIEFMHRQTCKVDINKHISVCTEVNIFEAVNVDRIMIQ